MTQSNISHRSPCITFYSYKGGSGRSTALMNTVKHLKNELEASANNPILIVDADLESAGLTFFFGCETKFSSFFENSLHTRKIFPKEEKELKRYVNEILKTNITPVEISESLIQSIAKLANLKCEITLGHFRAIKLPYPSQNALMKIVEIHEKYKNRIPENKTQERYILESYSLFKLCDDLIQIKQVNTESIIEAIVNFLPVHKFVDVSDFFGFEKDTILFLGTDTSSNESLARDDSEARIQLFLELFPNYKAIIFDSGAGTQSTADALHAVSDVIVYCLRPTLQFIKGTQMQINNYKFNLIDLKNKKGIIKDNRKPVILLPTAIPNHDDSTSDFCANSFQKIKSIATEYETLIDDTFCVSNHLPEISLFKWHEHILGTKYVREPQNGTVTSIINDKYSNYSDMPEDAKKAYSVYAKLAERIKENL